MGKRVVLQYVNNVIKIINKCIILNLKIICVTYCIKIIHGYNLI